MGDLACKVGNITGSTCAYWDEEKAAWAYDGLEDMPGREDGAAICLTHHLSIFAMIVKDVQKNAFGLWASSLLGGFFGRCYFVGLTETQKQQLSGPDTVRYAHCESVCLICVTPLLLAADRT